MNSPNQLERLFGVLDNGTLVYQCHTLLEGLAFLAGRRSGQLVGLLCPEAESAPPEKRKRTSKRKAVKS